MRSEETRRGVVRGERSVWRVREGERSAESYYQPLSPGIFISEVRLNLNSLEGRREKVLIRN